MPEGRQALARQEERKKDGRKIGTNPAQVLKGTRSAADQGHFRNVQESGVIRWNPETKENIIVYVLKDYQQGQEGKKEAIQY